MKKTVRLTSKEILSIPKKIITHLNKKSYPGDNESPLHPLIRIEQYKLIYFPIPKVACTTLKYICAKKLGLDRYHNIDNVNELHLISFPSVSRAELNIDPYQEYYKFACIRNPWDRLVSCYKSKIKDDPNYNDVHFKGGIDKRLLKYKNFRVGMSFEQFVDAVSEIPDHESDFHFRSQYDFVVKDKKLLVDFILYYESLPSDYYRLSQILGLDLPELPYMNSSKSSDYSDYYNTQKIIDKVAYRYSKDIKQFGYNFN